MGKQRRSCDLFLREEGREQGWQNAAAAARDLPSAEYIHRIDFDQVHRRFARIFRFDGLAWFRSGWTKLTDGFSGGQDAQLHGGQDGRRYMAHSQIPAAALDSDIPTDFYQPIHKSF